MWPTFLEGLCVLYPYPLGSNLQYPWQPGRVCDRVAGRQCATVGHWIPASHTAGPDRHHRWLQEWDIGCIHFSAQTVMAL